MGKDNAFTPKAIGNQMKGRGLTKLKYYCQPCKKFFRDENGYKCHCNSDSHCRQMALLGDAPESVIAAYSEQFEAAFLEHVRQAHPSTRVSAQSAYNEYIQDPHHVHMSATRWTHLSTFVEYLGREGKCQVDSTPKGIYIKLIKKDYAEEMARKSKAKRERDEKLEEKRLEDQAERARKAARLEQPKNGDGELHRDGTAPVRIALQANARLPPVPRNAFGAGPAARPGFTDNRDDIRRVKAPARPKTQMELLMEAEQAAKRPREQPVAAGNKPAKSAPQGRKDDCWLLEGLLVRVISAGLKEDRNYEKKGKVFNVSGYVGEIEMLESGDILKVDQADLETVVKADGGTVLVVKGLHVGACAEVLRLDKARLKAKVQLEGGEEIWLDYEHICKLA